MNPVLRPLPLSVHAALELPIGLALVVLPFVLGAGAAATLVAAVLGAMVGALSLSALMDGDLSVRAHATYDRAVGFALLLAAVCFAFTGDDGGALLFGLAAVGIGTLGLVTRYTR